MTNTENDKKVGLYWEPYLREADVINGKFALNCF